MRNEQRTLTGHITEKRINELFRKGDIKIELVFDPKFEYPSWCFNVKK